MKIATVLIFGVGVLASVAMGQVGVKADDLTSSLVSAKSTTGEIAVDLPIHTRTTIARRRRIAVISLKSTTTVTMTLASAMMATATVVGSLKNYGNDYNDYNFVKNFGCSYDRGCCEVMAVATATATRATAMTASSYGKDDGYGYGSGYYPGHYSSKDSATENTDAATTENGSKTMSKTKSSKEAKSSATNKPKHK
ncbi:hypothetical protein F442_13124 [Phytophthora nicotianae P10297]|uniref:Uncharacterized protein n=1 Tax=Phytophthora nicotianae P10297 TaxID=1317064 RepID=W2YW90_PHYNI|nr:hypothetical protein F442_13124 [Phytophthora nicotianae P10297]